MSVLLQYIASSGNIYNLKGDGIRTKTANFHRWEWGVEGTALQFGTRISGFTREAAVYESKLIFDGAYDDNKRISDALHEDFERDVLSMRPGRVVWRDWYIPCFIRASSTYPDANKLWADNEIEIYCPRPFWIKEDFANFFPDDGLGSLFLDYPYDYAYDYWQGQSGKKTWVRSHPFPSDFKMVIYGAATDPTIYINGHAYGLSGTISAGELVTIDSREHTIVKTYTDGTEGNWFDNRLKTSDIFAQIPGGSLDVSWAGSYGFDLTIYDERSEPAWS